MNRPSGDQKGWRAPSVPSSGFASSESRGRTQINGVPDVFNATMATRSPSGDILMKLELAEKATEPGGTMAKRTTGRGWSERR